MNREAHGFFAQNCWLKALVFALAIAGGCFASIRHLTYQTITFLVYFLYDTRIYGRLGFAMRKLLPFFAGYWLFATLWKIEFMDMLSFSLRLIFLVLISVYIFGTFEIEQLMQDSIGLRRIRVVQRIFYYALAIWLFIQSYFQIYAASDLSESKSMHNVMNKVLHALGTNYENSPRIDAEVSAILESSYEARQTITYPNLIAVVFLAILSIIYAL
ncbi:MAG: hypothetical protein CVU48_02720 [Candidatus Cloacimonetes bacterium HGW-Cloacimonetes-1]|jgi:hypothetical protein|nr:MAG: hypothetical protein CVU48_02720 [Candidatus Cloacimonetes bacterium HGW-Cloacimonetes-1]